MLYIFHFYCNRVHSYLYGTVYSAVDFCILYTCYQKLYSVNIYLILNYYKINKFYIKQSFFTRNVYKTQK